MIRLANVRAGYATPTGFVGAVDGVSLTIGDSEILGIAGESGCGKSTLIKVIYGQLGGALSLRGGTVEATFRDPASGRVTVTPAERLRELWWKQISYIPQGSMSVLNPVARIETQMVDGLPDAARARGRQALRAEIEAFLAEVKLPASVLDAYPHQLSGGMRQRVLVAMAAFFNPRLILADEPTTALDVVVQKHILLLLVAVQRRQRNALVIVSHDLGVHYQITDRLAIAYAGKIVEVGPTRALFERPRHPYTAALIDALPRLGDRTPRQGIEGRPPDLADPPTGCRFAPRCSKAQDVCRRESPDLLDRAPGHAAACHFA
ncbi:MAG: ABC transporter ATP-binding protein [Alphaproteobacteria bacterium]|nr:ABC transporter ATP-binding protein [Alphaproteobacteria bacterium]